MIVIKTIKTVLKNLFGSMYNSSNTLNGGPPLVSATGECSYLADTVFLFRNWSYLMSECCNDYAFAL